MAQEKEINKPTTEDATSAADKDSAVKVEAHKESKEDKEEAASVAEEPNNVQDSAVETQEADGEPEVAQAGETAAEAQVDPAKLAEKVTRLEAELETAQQEASKNLENWHRAAAELANFKRRQEEQLKLQRDRIKSEVLEGVISALDDLDLAFQNLPDELDGQLVGWVEGFRLVQRKLGKILDEQNVMPIDTAGQFDPNFHEAVSYEETDEHDTDHIIAELRKGYQIGSRVIRPALVRVAQ